MLYHQVHVQLCCLITTTNERPYSSLQMSAFPLSMHYRIGENWFVWFGYKVAQKTLIWGKGYINTGLRQNHHPLPSALLLKGTLLSLTYKWPWVALGFVLGVLCEVHLSVLWCPVVLVDENLKEGQGKGLLGLEAQEGTGEHRTRETGWRVDSQAQREGLTQLFSA